MGFNAWPIGNGYTRRYGFAGGSVSLCRWVLRFLVVKLHPLQKRQSPSGYLLIKTHYKMKHALKWTADRFLNLKTGWMQNDSTNWRHQRSCGGPGVRRTLCSKILMSCQGRTVMVPVLCDNEPREVTHTPAKSTVWHRHWQATDLSSLLFSWWLWLTPLGSSNTHAGRELRAANSLPRRVLGDDVITTAAAGLLRPLMWTGDYSSGMLQPSTLIWREQRHPALKTKAADMFSAFPAWTTRSLTWRPINFSVIYIHSIL